MKWLITLLALAGIVAASLALREHYRTEASPCSMNEKWDCGAVNKSSFAEIGGVLDLILNRDPMQPNNNKGGFAWIREIPVADVGIAGYLLLGVLAFMKRWRLLVAAAVPALAFSFYLAHIEKDVLGVWCIYCVISLGIISLLTLLSIFALVMDLKKRQRNETIPA
jgi:uncharacterized membrane protein